MSGDTPNGHDYPVIVGPDLSPEQMAAELHRHGALLFRGFDIHSTGAFEDFASRLCHMPMDYQDRASPRSALSAKVYTSTDAPPAFAIALHSESTFTQRWPQRIAFYCARPATRGGATPIAHIGRVYQSLSADVRERFERLGVMYVRNFGGGIGMDWREVFQVSDRDALETYCREAAVAFEWLPEDRLRTTQVRPAVLRHPETRETMWFNHALALHDSSLDPALRTRLLRDRGEAGLPHQVYLGDGSPLSDDVLAHIRETYARHTVRFTWQPGDVLLLDNLSMAHGRDPYEGERRVLAVLADPMGWRDIGQPLTLPRASPRHEPDGLRWRTDAVVAGPRSDGDSAGPPAGLATANRAGTPAHWLTRYLQQKLPDSLDLQASFVDNGGDSMLAVDLLDELFETHGIDLTIESLMDAQCLAQVLEKLGDPQAGRSR